MVEVQIIQQEPVIPFLHSDILLSDRDLRILSNDGYHFLLSKCVFAASCPGFANKIVRDLDQDDVSAITTELSKEDLGRVVKFFVSGVLPDLNQLQDGTLLDTFKLFGIDLTMLELIKEEETPEVCKMLHCRFKYRSYCCTLIYLLGPFKHLSWT